MVVPGAVLCVQVQERSDRAAVDRRVILAPGDRRQFEFCIDVKDDVRKDSFQPIVDETGGKIVGTEKSLITVT